jgi:hypothetical protein
LEQFGFLTLFYFSSHGGVMDLNSLLKEWEETSLSEKDETLLLIEELERIENRHRQILKLSSDLEGAYHQLLQKIKN